MGRDDGLKTIKKNKKRCSVPTVGEEKAHVDIGKIRLKRVR